MTPKQVKTQAEGIKKIHNVKTAKAWINQSGMLEIDKQAALKKCDDLHGNILALQSHVRSCINKGGKVFVMNKLATGFRGK